MKRLPWRLKCALLFATTNILSPALTTAPVSAQTPGTVPLTAQAPAKTPTAKLATIESMLRWDSQNTAIFNHIEKLLRKDPRNANLHIALARAYEKVGMTGLAEQEFEYIDAAFPDSKARILELFKESINRSDWKQASQLFGYVEKHYPNDPTVLFQSAIVFYRNGKLAAAQNRLNQLSLLNQSKRANKQGSIQQQQGLETFIGFISMEQKKYSEAIEHFNKELKNNPHFEAALICKSAALRALHRNAESLAVIKPLYLSQPLRKEFAFSMAISCVNTGNYRQALTPALITLALSKNQIELNAAKNRVRDIWSAVSPENRKQSLASATTLLQNTSLEAYFHFALGDTLQRMHSFAEAEEQFCKGLEFEPRHAKAYFHLGEIYQDHYFDNDSAFAFYQESIHLDSNLLSAQQKIKRLDARQTAQSRDVAQKLKSGLAAKATSSQTIRICSRLQKRYSHEM